MLARASLAMVTFLSWMANVRTSFFTVRIPVWNRSGLTLRSGGLENMLFLVPFFEESGGVLFANVCAGQVSSVSATVFVEKGAAWGLLVLLVVLLILGVSALLIYPLVCVGPEPRRRAFRWTRPSGKGRRGYCLPDNWKCATFGVIMCSTGYCWELLYMFVLVRLPSLYDNYACLVSWNKGALRRNCRQ